MDKNKINEMLEILAERKKELEKSKDKINPVKLAKIEREIARAEKKYKNKENS